MAESSDLMIGMSIMQGTGARTAPPHLDSCAFRPTNTKPPVDLSNMVKDTLGAG